MGSTALLTRLGEDAFHALRAEHDQLLRDAVERANGTVVKHGGDGIMAAFGSASDAVAAAVSLQQSIAGRNHRARERLDVRVGISTGDVRVEGDDYFGTPVVEAARLCNSCDGGDVVVADVVRILAGTHGGHVFQPLEPRALAGLPVPVPVARVEWSIATDVACPLPVRLQPDGSPFVGRVRERRELRDAWKRAAAGRTEAVFVAGEPGIGKTRLVAELARDAHADGAIVLFGRCDEEAGAPYQPFAEVIRAHAAVLTDEAVAEHAGVHAADIVRVVPELASRLGVAPSGAGADAESLRVRIFDAIVAWMACASRLRPVYVVVDDLHWAARSTLLALRHLVQSDAGATFFAATYRTTDLDREHPLSSLLADFRREPAISRIALTGLDSDEVVAFVEAAAEEPLAEDGQALARVIARDTSGNPFFVGEVLRNLVESGAIDHAEGGWRSDRTIDEIGIPEGVREVVGSRLSRLGETANTVLRAGAVRGAEFELWLLEALPSVTTDPLDVLDAASASGLVTELIPGRYTFAHAIVRRTLLDEASGARRLRLHREIFEALRERGDAALLTDIAYHGIEAAPLGLVGEATEAAVAAAAEAISRVAFEEAIAVLERSLEVLELDDLPLSRYEVLEELGQVWGGLYESARARAYALEAAEIALALGDNERLARASLGLALMQDPVEPDFALLEFANRLFDADRPLPDEALLLAGGSLAVARAFGLVEGDPRQAFDRMPNLRGSEPTELQLQKHSIEGLLELGEPDLDALFATVAALDRYDAGDKLSGWVMGRYASCYATLRRGDLAAFCDALDQMERHATERRMVLYIAQAAQWHALVAMLRGDLASVDAHIDRPLQISPMPGWLLGNALQRHWYALLRGDDDEVDAQVDRISTSVPAMYFPNVLRSWSAHHRGDETGGRAAVADEELRAALAMPTTWSRPAVIWRVAEIAAARNDRELAALAHGQLGAFDGQLVLDVCTNIVGSAATALAKLERVAGDDHAAAQHFAAGLALERAAGAEPLAARTLMAMGDELEAQAIVDRLGVSPQFLR